MTAILGWTAASALWWSDDPTTTWLEAERILLYVAALFTVFVATERDHVAQLLAGVAAGITFVSAYGLGRYVLDRGPLDRFEGNLLFRPIGYANGFGFFAALGIVIVVGLVLAFPTRRAIGAAAVALCILLPTLYETDSRASWIALVIGIATTVGLGRPTSLRLWLGLAGLAALVVAAVAIHAGGHGLAQHLLGENRPDYWRVAWKEYLLHPYLGSGPGTFANYWLHYRTNGSFARDAHSLYLETLAESGPIGLAIYAGALVLPLGALRRTRDGVTAVAAGAYVAFLVHTGVDWDWELPAVTVAALICGGALAVSARQNGRDLSPLARAVVLLPALAVGVMALVRIQSGRSLPFGP
jgi:O-antigen ligase